MPLRLSRIPLSSFCSPERTGSAFSNETSCEAPHPSPVSFVVTFVLGEFRSGASARVVTDWRGERVRKASSTCREGSNGCFTTPPSCLPPSESNDAKHCRF